MGKGSASAPKAPEPPDPRETAKAEAQFNRFDTFGPSGAGVRHGYTDAAGNFVAGPPSDGHQSAQQLIESPTDRAIRLMAEPAAIRATRQVIEDNRNLPDPARVRDRGTVADSIFNRTMSMIRPEIDKNQTRLLSNLQNRGIPVSSEAFTDSYTAQQRETDDMISRLAMDADIAAGQEQSRLFGLEASARQNSISELMAALTGQYAPPTDLPSGQGQPVNYASMVQTQANMRQQQYETELALYQQKQQQMAQTAGALGSLGAALIKSDRNVKIVDGFVDMGEAEKAVVMMPVQAWRYKEMGDDQPHIGPMAQDFHAATGLGTGTDIAVQDYLGLLHAALQSCFWRIAKLEHQVNGGGVH